MLEPQSPPIPPSCTNIPWLTSAFLAALTTGGTTYAFGLYGTALKHNLHLSQSQLDTISSANFAAGLLSWAPGMAVDRFGPRFGLIGGGLLGCTSLLSYWTVARQFVTVPHTLIVPTLSLLGVLIFISSALITGSVFKIIVVSCGPGTKGSAVGAAKGYVGLGAGAYSCLFQALRSSQESDLDFLTMAALFNVVAVIVPACLLLPSRSEFDKRMVQTLHPQQDVSTPTHYRALYVGLMALAMFVIVTSVMELYSSSGSKSDDSTTSSGGPHYGRAFLILLAWFGPILSFLYWPTAMHELLETEQDEEQEERQEMIGEKDDGSVALTSADADDDDKAMQSLLYTATPTDMSVNGNVDSLSSQASLPSVAASRPSEQQDKTLHQMLRTLPAWLMAWTCVILVGGGTIMTNNMGQMVESLEFPSLAASASLALFSVAQAGARVATGAISESALTWNDIVCGKPSGGVPRPAFLIAASIAGFLAHVLLAVTTTEVTFVLGAALSGAAFGMVWPLMVLIVGEVFGTANHGANYMFYDGFTSAVGTLLLSKFLAQEVYEDHIHRPSNDDDSDGTSDGLTCYGSACFRVSHLIVAGLSLTCVLTSVALLYTTRHVYKRRRIGSGDEES